jgi:hypothetical protein
MMEKATSYDNATVGSGNIVNEVLLAFNDFGQLDKDVSVRRITSLPWVVA